MTNLPEPKWVKGLALPEQKTLNDEVLSKHEELIRVQKELAAAEVRLETYKRWYRLLYDDGQSLEEIIKEGLELLGAFVVKTSREKDDYRLKVRGFVDGVVEIKGTHNMKFSIGALRQLAGWMDEANASDHIAVKGVFIGNSARNDELSSRGKLFETNCEDYANIKDIVIVRSMDIFCLVILKQLDLLKVGVFWEELFACKGILDAGKYWKLLPGEFSAS
jgi:hypothetical protein